MNPKAVTLIVRIWQGPDGAAKVSVKPTEGGPTQYFPSLEALMRYLEQAQEKIEAAPESSDGLR
ncbi:MAG: hypothetical protein ACK40N_00100 [Meiothermus ruber]|uniref:hypothetical protein n=1 Tax=Meiothermus TaxID=65551 RepID=UPI0026203D73|nr:hypothetical protein [Meiothermus sp.]MCX8087799.1 hypothetical protein [Meiothermus ruber]